MTKIQPLPLIMVAPNGARRTKQDHAELPVTIEETVRVSEQCFHAGADGVHLHVRGVEGAHILDAGMYIELLDELKLKVPDMQRQITTEAAGMYSPALQRQLVKDVEPDAVSVSIAEMHADGMSSETQAFYDWCFERQVAVQHILYGADDLELFDRVMAQRDAQESIHQLLFVLGRYAVNQQSRPSDLDVFTTWLDRSNLDFDWAACAFGAGETICLTEANNRGGKVRVGFENSLWNADGSIASDNAERVREVAEAIRGSN